MPRVEIILHSSDVRRMSQMSRWLYNYYRERAASQYYPKSHKFNPNSRRVANAIISLSTCYRLVPHNMLARYAVCLYLIHWQGLLLAFGQCASIMTWIKPKLTLLTFTNRGSSLQNRKAAIITDQRTLIVAVNGEHRQRFCLHYLPNLVYINEIKSEEHINYHIKKKTDLIYIGAEIDTKLSTQ